MDSEPITIRALVHHIEHLVLYSLKKSEQKMIELSKNDIKSFKSRLNKIVSEINDDKFNPNFGDHCKVCPYYSFCYN